MPAATTQADEQERRRQHRRRRREQHGGHDEQQQHARQRDDEQRQQGDADARADVDELAEHRSQRRSIGAHARAGAGSGAPWVAGGRTPERSRTPHASAPRANKPAAHQNAVTYPSTAAWRSSSGAAVRPATKSADADAASVLSSAVPTDPPTCWDVLTIAEATPLSRGATPRVAVAIDAAMIAPKPRPIRISDGRTWVA